MKKERDEKERTEKEEEKQKEEEEEEDAEKEADTPYERGRLSVKPGITCLWQISGRSDLPFDRQVELDLEYARVRSLRKDIEILLQTVPAVLFARGAY